MRPFEYSSPRSIDEALALLRQESGQLSRPLAGGTDLLPLMKEGIAAPTRLVSLRRLGGPCYAAHPSDLAPALLALDAVVHLHGPEGKRMLPLKDFLAPPEPRRRTETVIGGDELLVDVTVPSVPAGASDADGCSARARVIV